MVQVRLNALASIASLRTPAVAATIAGKPQHHLRDVLDRNWDLETLQNDTGNSAQFRAIIEQLRLDYDIEVPGHL